MKNVKKDMLEGDPHRRRGVESKHWQNVAVVFESICE